MTDILYDFTKTKEQKIKLNIKNRTAPIGAGTPINANGEIANDGTAIGLLETAAYYPYRFKESIITAGCIDEETRLKESGIILTEECKAALSNIKLISNEKLGASFGADLPFGETMGMGDTLRWDGNTEGLLSVDLLGDGTTVAYHITDVAPTLDDFAEGGWVAFSSGIKNIISTDNILPASETVLIDANYNFIVALEDGATATVPANGINLTLSAPKKGLYFICFAQSSRFITEFIIKRFGGFWGKNVVPLPRKYAEPNFIDFVAMGLPTITDMAITTVEDVSWLDDIVEQLTKDCGYARICVKLTFMQPGFWDVEYDENAINGRVGHTDTEILLPAFYTINKDYYDEPEHIDLIGRFRSSELYLRVGKDSVSGVVRHIDYLPLRTE